MILLAAIRLAAGPLGAGIDRLPKMWYGTAPLGLVRAAVQEKLSHYPGEQLAIVRYSSGHLYHDEWVYNDANIDGSKVVWAREMDPAANARLLSYYRNRTAWLVEPDVNPPRISRYAAPPP